MPLIKLTGRVKTLLVFIVLSDTKDTIKKHMNNFRICKLSVRGKECIGFSFINKDCLMVRQNFPREKIHGGRNDSNTCDQRLNDVHSNCNMT